VNARICQCCGERMPESQNPLCASCRAIEPPGQPEEQVANDDVVLRRNEA
jgi:hypothetical protein